MKFFHRSILWTMKRFYCITGTLIEWWKWHCFFLKPQKTLNISSSLHIRLFSSRKGTRKCYNDCFAKNRNSSPSKARVSLIESSWNLSIMRGHNFVISTVPILDHPDHIRITYPLLHPQELKLAAKQHSGIDAPSQSAQILASLRSRHQLECSNRKKASQNQAAKKQYSNYNRTRSLNT